MPTYSYACTVCDHRFDAQQAFSDAALTECPQCQGRLRKLFGNVGVVFKGSGFYRTDARKDGKSPAASGSSSGGTSTSTGSTPAPAPATAGAASSSGGSSSGGSSSGSSSSGGSSSGGSAGGSSSGAGATAAR
ncbi:FmdB family zinc ribbon protein [Actinotalea solisilvae]|uniref:FmdB family zinc ribbon protein n=1 Tax=Actinotalea solisilvae TaxID=2072922 RepID=UPI0018F24203|nr:FmdB family zinc ribbon protein [Actinotalea solisilvae]